MKTDNLFNLQREPEGDGNSANKRFKRKGFVQIGEVAFIS